MIEHVETLKLQGVEIPEQLVIDRVLHSLSRIKGYVQFRVNYNMQNMRTDLHELHKMLVQAERDMGLNVSTSKDVLNINTKSKEKFKKGANKGKKPIPYMGKGKAIENSSPKANKGATSEDKCHYCNGTSHWKRICPKYLGDIEAGRVSPIGLEKNEKA
ncbi:uncharacterized protein LOC141631503 [Silene latifolia]|uniref:uncharacterized protein LOC141631503 n=1 Tax=Silene latifolia TaxID=37657 RepID=UPI003D77F3C9